MVQRPVGCSFKRVMRARAHSPCARRVARFCSCLIAPVSSMASPVPLHTRFAELSAPTTVELRPVNQDDQLRAALWLSTRNAWPPLRRAQLRRFYNNMHRRQPLASSFLPTANVVLTGRWEPRPRGFQRYRGATCCDPVPCTQCSCLGGFLLEQQHTSRRVRCSW